MSGLSRSEKRGLRHIERELCDDDPQLARLLSEPAGSQLAPTQLSTRSLPDPRSSPPPRAAALVFISFGLGLIWGGISIGDMEMVFGGVMTLFSLPLIIVLISSANKAE